MQDFDSQDMLIRQVADLDEKAVLSTVRERIEAGYDPFRIMEACQEGVHLVGVRYEEGHYFIAGLIMAGVILRGVIELIRPHLESRVQGDSKGNLVLGTVQGDIHNIGKDLAGVLLSCEGFNVIDIGVDVPAEKFIQAVGAHQPKVLGLSCLLTTAFESLKNTVDALGEAGLRSDLNIIIGGSMINETVCKYAGADHWTTDAVKGLQWCKWVVNKR
jgi:methanogenic corrinoid protein MtbC1